MPLGSPIGSNKGLVTGTLKHYYEQASVPVVVDAGIGAHAAEAMEQVLTLFGQHGHRNGT